MPEIAFIMGKSSSGKDKIFKALSEDAGLNLTRVIPYTTRPMRAGETQGVEYNFVSDEAACRMQEEGRIIEMRSYNTVQGLWKYFTADDGQIELGKGHYIIIGTLEAYERFLEYFGEEHLLPIYIEVEDGVRLERALKREREQTNPDYAEMCRRFLADCADFSEENIKRCGISKRFYNNGGFEDCLNEIRAAIKLNFA
ncbi:MAG: guanylate kinase [Clostridia bacterium]|nr:guanylate kinase [Clostridia bacterium]